MPREDIERQAKLLARENRQAEPDIKTIYWFPDDNEVRLVEVLPTIPPSGQVQPYFFRAAPKDNLPAPSGIALINPNDVKLPPPEGWGRWEDAVELELEDEE